MIANPTTTVTRGQAPTPIFIYEMENRESVTISYGTIRRRDNEPSNEPLTKSKSRAVRILIEKDVKVSRSTMLQGCKTESEGEGTNSKSPNSAKRSSAREEGVEKRLERLKEELLAELKSQVGAQTSLRTSSPFVICVQEETIRKKFLMLYDDTENPRDHVINYKTFMELQTHTDALLCNVFPTILTGATLMWFNNLEVESIRTFGDLANSFMGKFVASILA